MWLIVYIDHNATNGMNTLELSHLTKQLTERHDNVCSFYYCRVFNMCLVMQLLPFFDFRPHSAQYFPWMCQNKPDKGICKDFCK